MEPLSNLKSILHSKRTQLYYLEKCRVMTKDGRVVYHSAANNDYWNIPISNTIFILLGMGCSITNSAMRVLTSAGVMVGFSGTGGTPLFAGTEVMYVSPLSEYRPTEYLQEWVGFWLDPEKRLKAAIAFQLARVEFIKRVLIKDRDLHRHGISLDVPGIHSALKVYEENIQTLKTTEHLLLEEARLTKKLYGIMASLTGYSGFTRSHDGGDLANDFLNHGNYLVYGLSGCALWVLGIPHAFPVMHGNTRRGALVFDVADLCKDGVILPFAFAGAKERLTERAFRERCLLKFQDHGVMDYMFDTIKAVSTDLGRN